MRTLVIWGAGRIGRGFVAGLFHEPGWRIVFVDIDRALVDLLNGRGGYTVFRATKEGIIKTRIEGGFTALHTDDHDALQKLFLEEGLMLDIAVHEPKLPEVASMLAPLFTARAEANAGPMDVMMNVNMAGPDEAFIRLMRERLTGGAEYRRAAEALLDGLIDHCCDWSKDRCGLLTHCTASYHDDAAGVHTNIVYGDYFFVEALAKLNGTDPMLWRK